MEKINKKYGRLDVAINNAGILTGPDVEQENLAGFERMMKINVNGVFLACQNEIALMKKTGGSIVNLSSVAGLAGSPSFIFHSF